MTIRQYPHVSPGEISIGFFSLEPHPAMIINTAATASLKNGLISDPLASMLIVTLLVCFPDLLCFLRTKPLHPDVLVLYHHRFNNPPVFFLHGLSSRRGGFDNLGEKLRVKVF